MHQFPVTTSNVEEILGSFFGYDGEGKRQAKRTLSCKWLDWKRGWVGLSVTWRRSISISSSSKSRQLGPCEHPHRPADSETSVAY
ncbi:hypothetical protein AXX17_AT5G50110 [Arabidopsis thaliana]|uniref:Uncharacterized protein n=1 Tax=Arabidopsis thaliana TaxID=3702 RepID=A0A178U9Z8_ARATH|nr:hypothetical protein AXX17_AT5G50110 [Arabidopsis thaliana]